MTSAKPDRAFALLATGVVNRILKKFQIPHIIICGFKRSMLVGDKGMSYRDVN